MGIKKLKYQRWKGTRWGKTKQPSAYWPEDGQRVTSCCPDCEAVFWAHLLPRDWCECGSRMVTTYHDAAQGSQEPRRETNAGHATQVTG